MANWKEEYKEDWEISTKKENDVKESLMNLLNCDVVHYGLGSGSSEYIKKEDEPNDHEKGDPDLYILDIDTYVEVTGPNIPITFDAPLWVRPDKITNSKNKINESDGKLHIVVHVAELTESNGTIFRIIELNNTFIQRVDNSEFELIHPYIKGKRETYYEIPYDDVSVNSYYNFVMNRLKPLFNKI